MSRPPVNPSRSFELRSSTGVVRIEIDEHGQIVWDDELRSAYEYEEAFRAMGGDWCQLTLFMAGWEAKAAGTGPVRTMLGLLDTSGQLIEATTDALNNVVEEIAASPVWADSFRERDVVLEAVKLARNYVLGGRRWSWDEQDVSQFNLDHRKIGCSILGLNVLNAAQGLLSSLSVDVTSAHVHVGAMVMSIIMEVFQDCMSAMGYVISGRKTVATITNTDWFDATQEWRGRQVARLAELVHVSQLGVNEWARLMAHLRGLE
jgi:hypothetical protein